MSLNIKNEHVHALAREAARRTGKTQTSVIELALERLLAETEREGRRERVERVLAKVDAFMTDDLKASLRTAELELYDDETGLPA